MKSILTLITLGFTTLVFAQAQLPPEIEDPECLGINLEPPHATLMPYASMKEALAAKRADSSFSRSLNGLWKFNWVEHPAKRPVDFFKPDFDVSGMKETLAAKRADSSFSRSLNGLWKFNWVEHPAKRPVDFFKPDFDVSGWKE